jgi:dihydrofolate reductase
MSISLIAAVNFNNVIGKNGKLPWHLPEDLEHFRKLTTGNIVIMGRKTFESLGSKPLKNRLNIVVSKSAIIFNPIFGSNIIASASPIEAVTTAQSKKQIDQEIFCIGGESLYKQMIQHADKIFLTRVHVHGGGDTFFPELDESWDSVDSKDAKIQLSRTGVHYSFSTYKR